MNKNNLPNEKSIVQLIALVILLGHFDIVILNILPLDYLLLLILGVVLLFSKLFYRNRVLLFSVPVFLMLFFVIYNNITIFWSQDFLVTLTYSSRFIFLIMLFIASINLREEENINYLLNRIVKINFFVSVVSLIKIILGLYPRFYNRFLFLPLLSDGPGDPNFTSVNLVISIFSLIYFLSDEKSKKQKWKNIGMILYFLILLLWTFSRGTFAFLGVLFILYLINNRPVKNKKMNVKSIYMVYFFLFLLSILGLYFKNDILEGMRFDTLEGFSGRTDIWERAFEIISESPVIGHGAGMFRQINLESGLHMTTATHSSILELLVGGGIIAILPLVILYIYDIYIILQSQKRADQNKIRKLVIMTTFFLTLSALSLNMETSKYYWLFIGLFSNPFIIKRTPLIE